MKSLILFSAFLASVCSQKYKVEQFESCFTPEKAPGQCISIRSCPSLANLLKVRPFPPEYSEYLKKALCGFEGLDPKVCCPLNSEPPPSITPSVRPKAPVVPVTSHLLPDVSECGPDLPLSKLYGGEIADMFEFPWMALLQYETPKGYGFYCGGALINRRYILTAAHCLVGKSIPKSWNLVNVVLGEYNIETKQDCVNSSIGYVCSDDPEVVSIAEKIPNEYYDPFDVSQQNDIALLRLSRNVEYSDFIKPICLPTTKTLLENSFVDTNATVSGWGRTETSVESKLKMKLRVPVKSNAECSEVYSSQGVRLNKGHMCAGGVKGKDSCSGDSGGPLMNHVIQNTVNWYITGVVSFGPEKCGLEHWPGIYTRVTEYVPWIVRNLKP